MWNHRAIGILVAATMLAMCVTNAEASLTFDWATVANPGNGPDHTGFGSVGYTYQISKHEVTNGQYIEFLTAVASVGDPNGLYHPAMRNSIYGGIQRDGSGTVVNPYVYTPKGGDSNWLGRPANVVSWYDALRFTNWLHNGQPSGAQDATTTEDGAYDMSLGAGVVRKADAGFFLPTENEWYKAAYHANNGATADYWHYATGIDALPEFVNDAGNLNGTGVPFSDGMSDPGNYATYDGLEPNNVLNGIGPPYYTTNVGEWENSASPYGTYDQAGNIREWNETLLSNSTIGYWGGSFADNDLSVNRRRSADPAINHPYYGFRVATAEAAAIPEPSSFLVFTGLGLLGIGYRRWTD